MNRAIFFDRDNTIVKCAADSSDPQQVSLIRGAAHAIASLRQLGFRIIIIANEGAVARGVCTEAEVDAVHQYIAKMAHEAAGAIIDRFYFCPYHPNGTVEAYRREHPWRKPSPGMILQAARDLDVNLAESWMVGDSECDIEAGRAAGCRTILVGDHAQEHDSSKAQYKVETLAEAAAVIAQYKARSTAPVTARIVTKKTSITAAGDTQVQLPATANCEIHTQNIIAESIPDSAYESIQEHPSESTSTTTRADSATPIQPIEKKQEETSQAIKHQKANIEVADGNTATNDIDAPEATDENTNGQDKINNEKTIRNELIERETNREPTPADTTEKIRKNIGQPCAPPASAPPASEPRSLCMPITAIQSDDESAAQTEARTNRLLMDVLSEIRSWRTSAREFTPVRLFAFVAMAMILLGALASAIYIEGDRGLAWIGVALVAQLTVIGLLILLPNG